ncbi:hypothetical protein Btru_056684 [Bulinus truncatus]|nr:hypothetical protein Btru_056684 [Bulinus truncatus]
MPKRANPFGDHTCLQLKTHVREKEVDKGVNEQIRMQSVYERTQALLFSGMKHLHDTKSAPVNYIDIEITDSELLSRCENSSLKQLHLSKNCELVSDVDEEMEMEFRSSLSLIPPTSTTSGCNAQVNNIEDLECQAVASSSTFSRTLNKVTSPHTVPQLNVKSVFDAGPSCSFKQTCNPFVVMKSAQSKLLSNEKSFLGVGACHNCRNAVQTKDVMKCQFCENYVCYPCVRQCNGCHLHFCQLCSVLNYTDSREKAFCLNCSGMRGT